jgi:hypothetical protein
LLTAAERRVGDAVRWEVEAWPEQSGRMAKFEW